MSCSMHDVGLMWNNAIMHPPLIFRNMEFLIAVVDNYSQPKHQLIYSVKWRISHHLLSILLFFFFLFFIFLKKFFLKKKGCASQPDQSQPLRRSYWSRKPNTEGFLPEVIKQGSCLIDSCIALSLLYFENL